MKILAIQIEDPYTLYFCNGTIQFKSLQKCPISEKKSQLSTTSHINIQIIYYMQAILTRNAAIEDENMESLHARNQIT